MIYGFRVCFPSLPNFAWLGFLLGLLDGSVRLWWGHRLGFVEVLRKGGLSDPLAFVWAVSGALFSPFEIGNFPILSLRFLCCVVFWRLSFNCLMNLEYEFQICFWDFGVYCVSWIVCARWRSLRKTSVFNLLPLIGSKHELLDTCSVIVGCFFLHLLGVPVSGWVYREFHWRCSLS